MPKELAPVCAGDKLRDNDPRTTGRVVSVFEVQDEYVVGFTAASVKVRIRRDRIHADGKPRRSGFDLIR